MVNAFTAGLLSGAGNILADQRKAEEEADRRRSELLLGFENDKKLLGMRADEEIRVNKAKAAEELEAEKTMFKLENDIVERILGKKTTTATDSGETGEATTKSVETFDDLVEKDKALDIALESVSNKSIRSRLTSSKEATTNKIAAVQKVFANTVKFREELAADAKAATTTIGYRTAALDTPFTISTPQERANLATVGVVSRKFIEKEALKNPRAAVITAEQDARKLATNVYRILKLPNDRAAVAENTPIFTKDVEGRVIPNKNYFALVSKSEFDLKIKLIDKIISDLRDKGFDKQEIVDTLTPEVFDSFSAYIKIKDTGERSNIDAVQGLKEIEERLN